MELGAALARTTTDKLGEMKRDPWEFGRTTGKQQVFQMARCDADTGAFIEYVYVDAEGNEVDISGYTVVPTTHPEAVKESERVSTMMKSRAERAMLK